MKRLAGATLLVLVALCASAFGLGWNAWVWQTSPQDVHHSSYDLELTENNGAHAVALGEYWESNAWHYWTSVVAKLDSTTSSEIMGYEWKDGYSIDQSQGDFPYRLWGADNRTNPCVAANDSYKLWMSSTTTFGGTYEKLWALTDLLKQQSPSNHTDLIHSLHGNNDHSFTGVCFGNKSDTMCVAYDDYTDSLNADRWALHYRWTTDAGEHWTPDCERYNGIGIVDYGQNHQQPASSPSLAVASRETVYVVYENLLSDPHSVVFKRSINWGDDQTWGSTSTLGSGDQPCVAAVGPFVFVCWRDGDRVYYSYSTQGGSLYSWTAAASINGSATGTYSQPNVSVITCGSQPGVLFACQWYHNGKRLEFSKFGHLVVTQSSSHIAWQSNVSLSPIYTQVADDLRPSVATVYSNLVGAPMGANVYNIPQIWPYYRGIDLRYGSWKYCESHADGEAATGRLIARAPDGSIQYASTKRPHIVSGPADADLIPILVGPGSQPALALDGDGNRWVSYVSADTVWTMTGDGTYKVAFAGSSSAVPGQPSIVCYPTQANGEYVTALAFAVYDTAGSASRIMFARACSSQAVILDTVAMVNNLRDSLPSVNVYKTDSLVVTWQHGDSVLSSLLADYGPGTAGQPPAWSSVNLVTAAGQHPMSVMENGSVVNCLFDGHSGGNYSVQRYTNDLSGGMFGGWVAQTAPSTSSAAEKANSVYAGVGVSVWQQKVGGKWVIKGFVRGAETTLVANDTEAYCPNAVAESSAISPSINQIRCHLLYTAGVAFEVDSAVYDTGEIRYVCDSFDVSHAGANATAQNNGSKLIRQGDSLYAIYADLDGSVVYAWSAAGDSWQRSIMATTRDNPAIAEDSTGKRWVVVHKAPVGMFNGEQQAYYRNGSSWTGPQTLYSAGLTSPIGPASIAGASSTTSSIAYAAFLTTSGANKSVVVAKFNGTWVSTYTLATGSSLGDPAIAVEPYKTDSDHVHVTWDDNGIVKYRMAADGRGSTISTTWTTAYVLTGNGVTGHHPVIGANRSRIVVAWAQGATADIYGRKRATSDAYNTWGAAADLSNTPNNASDWPTIAMGDTVVVAWEETRTPIDHDIMACIEFGDTLNIADNVTVSSYPHVVFQNKTSGDTLIPYLHTVWSEIPQVSYYEVRYNKLDLKHPDGEGQQSAKQVAVPLKPSLSVCSPNPFRSHTQIRYALPAAGNVSLRVYDVTGRTVRTLASGHQRAGNYSVSWDARDSRGRQVPYGVYFYRLDTPGFREVKKAVVAR